MKPFSYTIKEEGKNIIYEDSNNLIISRLFIDMYVVKFNGNSYNVYDDPDELFVAKYYVDTNNPSPLVQLESTDKEIKLIRQLMQMSGMVRNSKYNNFYINETI
tara:strand:+ start:6550 stop:6861 length:312 start_codon:yes stop_codon:yes gene_type:complete